MVSINVQSGRSLFLVPLYIKRTRLYHFICCTAGYCAVVPFYLLYCRILCSIVHDVTTTALQPKFKILSSHFFFLRTRRLRWYGHVQRATSCINSITRLGLPGTRNRGRPRKTWSACVRNDMTICNLDGVNPSDRNSWRTSVRRCQVLPTPESGTTAAP